jgi:Tol biopolymer transport system component
MPVLGTPRVDHVLDLNTGVKTSLPQAIIRSLGSLGQAGRGDCLALGRRPCSPQYAVSRDGARLAYLGTDEEGRPQIFIAGVDGSGIRQMTHDPSGAATPAWSPDGTMVAYAGYGRGHVRNLFVLGVDTGRSTQITDGRLDVWGPQFTPDGSSLIYTGGSDQVPEVRIVPATGGTSTLLIGPSEGLTDAGDGSLSPDGSLVTYLASGKPSLGYPQHCGPCRWVANADGTARRVVPGWISHPAGTWSPDGTRIVCSETDGVTVYVMVVEVTTGSVSFVTNGAGAIWLDDHSLLVEV